MRDIHVILKTTNGCNLRCKYCYNSESEYNGDILPLEKFEKLMRLLVKEYDSIHVVWHGGEPLYCGLDYFEKAMEIEQNAIKGTAIKLYNSVQTNGTLINKDWINFFKKYEFRPGVSFDGINNDKYRQGTQKTLEGIELLKKSGIKFGCMAVVADNEFDMLENYKYFASQGIQIEFSHIFNEGGAKKMDTITPEKYVDEVKKLFDYWLRDKNGVGIRTFVSYISMAMGNDFRMCDNSSCHGKYLGISPSGDFYNCSRHSVYNYCFGNIDNISSISELYKSEGFFKLLKGSIERRKKCLNSGCQYFEFCQGGCPDCAMAENGLDQIPQSTCYCFRHIFEHIRTSIKKILDEKVPLSELNPEVKNTLIKCFSVGDGSDKQITDKYI